jgi:hypothetical protein
MFFVGFAVGAAILLGIQYHAEVVLCVTGVVSWIKEKVDKKSS